MAAAASRAARMAGAAASRAAHGLGNILASDAGRQRERQQEEGREMEREIFFYCYGRSIGS
jgi:hypothetical protein